MDAISELKALSLEIEAGYEAQAAHHRAKLAELRSRIEEVELLLAGKAGDGHAPHES